VKRRALAILLASALAACGGAPSAARPNAPGAPAPAETTALVVEYVVLHRRWVEKFVPTPAADVKAWSEAPENAETVASSFRHILVKIPGDAKDADVALQRKKAQALLDRLKNGEDFATLAKQLSEDPGSKANGGEYASDKVKDFVEPVRNAFASLKSGETTPDLVRTKFGFHIIRKDRASDELIERAYRKAKAPEATKRLGEELLSRLKGGAPARSAIAEAVEAVLGARASSDEGRPNASSVDRDRLRQVRLSAAAKAAIETFANGAHPGEVLPSPAVDGDIVLVARARVLGAR
jgi:hypothetical protein